MTTTAHETEQKVRENRLRRMAQRQDLTLVKSRRRDVRAMDYGCYWLVADHRRTPVLGGGHGTDLDAVEAFLLRA